MTGERRTPWLERLEKIAGNTYRVVPGLFSGKQDVIVPSDDWNDALQAVKEVQSRLAVSAINAGGDAEGTEPAAWPQDRRGHCIICGRFGMVDRFARCADHAIPAAPVAIRPEPAGEVEWRVSEDKLIEIMRGAAPHSNKQYLALDLRDARAALARRPSGQPKALSDYTDAELSAEMHFRTLKMLGPPWESVQTGSAPPDADTPDDRDRRLAEGGDGS